MAAITAETTSGPRPLTKADHGERSMRSLVFFILLFSLGIQDRKKYSRIAESLEAMVGPRESGLNASTGVAKEGDADFTNFDEASRRTTGSSPDAATIKRVRGDKNRQVLVD